MFTTWRTIGGAIGLIALIFGFPFMTPWLSRKQRTTLFIAEVLITAECLLFFVQSRNLWRIFTRVLDKNANRTSVNEDGKKTALKRLIKCLLVVILTLSHYSLVSKYFYYGTDRFLVNFASFVCLGVTVQFSICHFCITQPVRFYRWLSRSGSFNYMTYTRMYSKTRILNIAFVMSSLFTLTMSTYGVIRALQPPVVVNVDIPIANLARSLDKFNIVVISDIHLGPTVSRQQLERIVHTVNDLKPGLECDYAVIVIHIYALLYDLHIVVCHLN